SCPFYNPTLWENTLACLPFFGAIWSVLISYWLLPFFFGYAYYINCNCLLTVVFVVFLLFAVVALLKNDLGWLARVRDCSGKPTATPPFWGREDL
ncbi:hypothetical protein ACFQ0I_16840, partial [Mariniflexile aquimaris]